ncbi:MAG: N-acetyl sugar amidotransferase [Candidatus Calescibacterium sp.]|nr:N-acetyl sugar amidotransferase [Candidatus Calescibacterium sp.]
MYRICNRCIMDTTVPEIFFDHEGNCNFCNTYLKNVSKNQSRKLDKKFDNLINQIKKNTTRKYNCVLGLSGGTDSSYLSYIVHKAGLKPLVVHLDNGWNSELSVKNIENIINKLGFDLYTYVINWEEFRDMQLAYLKASVLDLEALTDHAIIASLYKIANEKNLKYIVLGTNMVTEAILPDSFRYPLKTIDAKNIKHIHAKYGRIKRTKTFPYLTLSKYFYFKYIKKIKIISLLDYVEYDKAKAKKILESEFGWRDYGGKHYESIITRFYQGYILPKKFKIDKRMAHLSTLICSGQITREQALEEMKKPIYDEALLKEDKNFFIKKMKLTEEEFEQIMNLPPKSHLDYPNNKTLLEKLSKIKRCVLKW